MGRGFFDFSRVGIYVVVVVACGLLSRLKCSTIVPKMKRSKHYSLRSLIRTSNLPFSYCSLRSLFSQGQDQAESSNAHGNSDSNDNGRSDTSTPGIILVLGCK